MVKPLWIPSEQRIKNTNMFRFIESVNERHNTNFTDYDEANEVMVMAVNSERGITVFPDNS